MTDKKEEYAPCGLYLNRTPKPIPKFNDPKLTEFFKKNWHHFEAYRQKMIDYYEEFQKENENK